MNTYLESDFHRQTDPAERRIAARLPVRKLNVLISGAILNTVDISEDGAQVHCSKAQFPLIERFLDDPVEIVIELPIGRELTAEAHVAYVRQQESDVFIGFGFTDFRHQDRRGWQAFIANQAKSLTI